MLVYLIRHGATAANERVPFVLQGDAIDLPLNENGRRQARDLAEFFRNRPLAAVYSSRMLRARETGQEIARAVGADVQPVDGLQECNVGVWEGLDWATIHARHPEEAAAFQRDPAAHPMLGGESYRDVLSRARPAWDRLVAAHVDSEIALVTHNVVNRVLLADLLGLEPRQGALLRQRNGCINLIEISDGKPQVVTVNSVFHLSTSPSAAW
jgi:broad specificity phosphatase PhoE